MPNYNIFLISWIKRIKKISLYLDQSSYSTFSCILWFVIVFSHYKQSYIWVLHLLYIHSWKVGLCMQMRAPPFPSPPYTLPPLLPLLQPPSPSVQTFTDFGRWSIYQPSFNQNIIKFYRQTDTSLITHVYSWILFVVVGLREGRRGRRGEVGIYMWGMVEGGLGLKWLWFFIWI